MSTAAIGQTITCATLNVKFDPQSSHPVPIPEHGAITPHPRRHWDSVYKEHGWAERRSRLVDALLSTGELDIAGFQEVLHSQLLDISQLLGQGYGHVGVGRDDGKEAGEHSPIFYNKDKFEVVRWKTIWLSPTPDAPGSKGWDANLTRIATILTLSWVNGPLTGQLVHAVNTHYDDAGRRARAESSLIIREHIAKWVSRFEDRNNPTSAPAAPVILLGDFNSPPEEEGYKNITSTSPLPSGQPSLTFMDAYTHLSSRGPGTSGRQSRPYGPAKTYTGFTSPGKTQTTRIDFVMLASAAEPKSQDGEGLAVLKPRGGWEVEKYACIDNWIEEGDADGWTGRWSDHRAVMVTIRHG